MRNLDHPNIVQLVEFSESKQYYYIILELCPGGGMRRMEGKNERGEPP